jgi:hypothetical protein
VKHRLGKGEGGIVDKVWRSLMTSTIWNVFVKDNGAGVKEVICFEASNTVASSRGWISHEEALDRFIPQFGLEFQRNMGKAAHSSYAQIGNGGLLIMKNFERCDMERES